MRYGDGDAPSKLEAPTSFCKILLLERAGRWEWNMQLARKKAFLLDETFLHSGETCLLKTKWEGECRNGPCRDAHFWYCTERILQREQVYLFLWLSEIPPTQTANTLIFFFYLLIEHNSPSPFPASYGVDLMVYPEKCWHKLFDKMRKLCVKWAARTVQWVSRAPAAGEWRSPSSVLSKYFEWFGGLHCCQGLWICW